MQQVSPNVPWTHAQIDGRLFPRIMVTILSEEVRVIRPILTYVPRPECIAELAVLVAKWRDQGYGICADVLDRSVSRDQLGSYQIEGEEVIVARLADCRFYAATA